VRRNGGPSAEVECEGAGIKGVSALLVCGCFAFELGFRGAFSCWNGTFLARASPVFIGFSKEKAKKITEKTIFCLRVSIYFSKLCASFN
jgi:hypothetical protein